jgi:hypothetical protein
MRKILFTTLMIFVFAASLYAGLPANNPFAIVSQGAEGDNVLYTLKTDSGFSFTLLERAPVTEYRMNMVKKIIGTVTGFGTIKIGSARVIVKDDAVECFVTLASFSYKDIDFTRFIPSGMAFFMEDNLQYDVSVVVQKQRVRVTGQYSSEQKLVELLDRVVARPSDYLRMQDPEYIMDKFNEYDNRLSALQEVVLFMGNRGFFKLVTPIARETIDTVIGWKRENPALTVDEVLEKAKDQDLSFKKKEVQMIFIVYFKEYPPTK